MSYSLNPPGKIDQASVEMGKAKEADRQRTSLPGAPISLKFNPAGPRRNTISGT